MKADGTKAMCMMAVARDRGACWPVLARPIAHGPGVAAAASGVRVRALAGRAKTKFRIVRQLEMEPTGAGNETGAPVWGVSFEIRQFRVCRAYCVGIPMGRRSTVRTPRARGGVV